MSSYVSSTFYRTASVLGDTDVFSVSVPAGAASGDVLLALCYIEGGSSKSTVGPNNMTGWTVHGADTDQTNSAGWATVYSYTLNAETTFDFTKIIDGSDRYANVSLLVFRGVDEAGILRTQDATAFVQFPALTKSETGQIVRWYASKSNDLTSLSLSGYTQAVADFSANTSQWVGYDEDLTTSNVPFLDSGVTDTASGNISDTIFLPDGETGPATTITDLDGDNAVDQYQQCNANGVSGLGGPVTSATLGGEACTVVDGDWQTNAGVVALGMPGNLATGTYDLILSDGTDTATLSGVSYTQTHARPAFDGLVDSNSILNGQSYTANTYFRFVTSFSNGTLDLAVGDAAGWAGDIADYYTPNGGFSGDDTATIEFLYSDGVTSAAVSATITVGASGGGVAPQGTVTIGVITKDETTASIPFTYDLSDYTGFEYRIGAGEWQVAESPINLTGLESGVQVTGDVRAKNATGSGVAAGFSFTTNAAPQAQDNWPFGKNIRYTATKTWEWGNRHPLTGSRVRIHK